LRGLFGECLVNHCVVRTAPIQAVAVFDRLQQRQRIFHALKSALLDNNGVSFRLFLLSLLPVLFLKFWLEVAQKRKLLIVRARWIALIEQLAVCAFLVELAS